MALYQLGSMMQKDGSVKEYMETEAATEDGPFLNEMAMRLTNYRKLNPNISTVSLVRYLDEKVYYAGHKWQADRQGLYEKMKSAYLNAAETGEGCNEYIVKKRMEQAMLLLESTALRSGEIAWKVGYKDVNYFSAAFKKKVGMSPREYRERKRNGKGI